MKAPILRLVTQFGGIFILSIMTKDTFYFSHDYNARQDDKIKRLIRKHGMAGYGIFWAIVEDLYNNANALRLDCEGMAFEYRVGEDVIESIINDFDLFVFDGELFGSKSVENRLNERDKKSKKASENARKRWDKHNEINISDANALQTQSDGNAKKERKGKEKKERKGKEIIIPSLIEFCDYVKLQIPNEYSQIEKSLKLKYEAWKINEWKDGYNTPIVNWKAKVLNTIQHLKKENSNGITNPNDRKIGRNTESEIKAFIEHGANLDAKMEFNRQNDFES
jgi:hypothetical protein